MSSENLSSIEAPGLEQSCPKSTLPLATRLRDALRDVVTVLRRLYFVRVWHMEIGEGSVVSFSAKLDKTNPTGIHIGTYSVVAFGAAVLSHDWVNRRDLDVYIGNNCF